MERYVSKVPWFISHKFFSAEDGESALLVEFDSLESENACRDHPVHVIAQRRGREEFFADVRV